jgi:hypothetical protein
MNLKKNGWRSCFADPSILPPANFFATEIESSLDLSVSSFDEVLHQCQVRACGAAKWHQATAPSGTSTSLRGCFPVLAQGVEDVLTMPFAGTKEPPAPLCWQLTLKTGTVYSTFSVVGRVEKTWFQTRGAGRSLLGAEDKQ